MSIRNAVEGYVTRLRDELAVQFRTADIDRIVEFFLTIDEAERVRSEVLRDEPAWAASLEVVRVDFGRGAVVESAAQH